MDMIAKLKSILVRGDLSYDDLVTAGLIRSFGTDQELYRDRLLEFQARYGVHSFDFYRVYRAESPGVNEGLDGVVQEDDADEWAWLYEKFVSEGGDPFTLPFHLIEPPREAGQGMETSEREKRGQDAPAFLVHFRSPAREGKRPWLTYDLTNLHPQLRVE